MDPHHYVQRTTTSEKTSKGLFASPIPFALALLGAGSVVFSLWYFFYAGPNRSKDQPVPIIQAESSPIKIRPDSSEQPEVPHQDKLVYSRVNPAEQAKGVENLLPMTEEPMEVAEEHEPEAITNTQKEAGFPLPNQLAENASEFRVDPMPVETKEEPMKMTVATAEPEVPAIPTEAAPKSEMIAEKKSEPETAPAQETKKAKALASGYRIQLASMKSQELVKQEWKRLKSENEAALGHLSAQFNRVDLGAKKGVFFRLQAGDFADRSEAQNACDRLKDKNPKAGCIIVKF